MLRVYPSAHCSQKLPLYCGGQLQSSTLNAFSGEVKTLVLKDNKEEQTTWNFHLNESGLKVVVTHTVENAIFPFISKCNYRGVLCVKVEGVRKEFCSRDTCREQRVLGAGNFRQTLIWLVDLSGEHRNPKQTFRQLTGSLPLNCLKWLAYGWVEQLIQRKLDVSKNAAKKGQDVSFYYLSEEKLKTMFGGKTKNIVVFLKRAYGRKHSELNVYRIPIA